MFNQNVVKKNSCSQQMSNSERYLNPLDIEIQQGYQIEVYASGLDAPDSMVFTETGDIIIGESGITSGNPKVLRLTRDGARIVVGEGFQVPLTGVNYRNGDIYVSHRGFITVIKPDGTKQNIISGLPSNGDHHNSQIVFGLDDKMYFGQGTVTNSGVVGLDNRWLMESPFLRDLPGSYVILNGQNFITENIMVAANERAYTGAFVPFGVPNRHYEVERGYVKASGSILRANLDGSSIELVAWGFRDPISLKFDRYHRLFVTNHGYDSRGSRPIANAPDDFYLVIPGVWYGWPDYSGGEPVTLPKFQPEGRAQPEFLITSHPAIPPKPIAIFPPHCRIMGFDFNHTSNFGFYGDAFVAEFGTVGLDATGGRPYAGIGHRISKIDMNTGVVTTFAMNKSGLPASITGEGGFGRPVDVVFGPDDALYVLDFSTGIRDDDAVFLPDTGVIWKITKT